MKLEYTWEAIEALRDRIHRRTPDLAVHTKLQAHRFVEKVGFCFLFHVGNSELPSLWNAMCGMRDAAPPKRSRRDSYLSYVPDLKSILPDGSKVFYGRVLQGRPTVISREYLPCFLALARRSGKRDEYVHEFLHDRLSPLAKEIMEALLDDSPLDSKGLKLAVGGATRHRNAGFEKAIAELQSKMFIVNAATEYDPFIVKWEPIYRSFGPQLKRIHKFTLDDARLAILGKYFESQVVSSVQAIHQVFGWKKQAIFRTLGALVNEGTIVPRVKVDGNDHTFYAHIT